MLAIGQARVNAEILNHFFSIHRIKNKKIYAPGCGTGQLFEFMDQTFIRDNDFLFTDIRAEFLSRARDRLATAKSLETKVDDIESSSIVKKVDVCTVVLLFEHVNWPRPVHVLEEQDYRTDVYLFHDRRRFYVVDLGLQTLGRCKTVPCSRKKFSPNVSKEEIIIANERLVHEFKKLTRSASWGVNLLVLNSMDRKEMIQNFRVNAGLADRQHMCVQVLGRNDLFPGLLSIAHGLDSS